MLTGNKGEWSELYALMSCIAHREIYDIRGYPHIIKKISRKEDNRIKDFILKKDSTCVSEKGKLDIRFLKDNLKFFLKEIKNGKGRAFSCPEMEKAMNYLGITKIKSNATNKDDFSIQFEGAGLQGFNVKSDLGSCSGLINASKCTNFTYEVFSDLDIDDLNFGFKSKPSKTVRKIYDNGGRLEFRYCSDIYKMQLGTEMTTIFSLLIIEYFKSKKRSISDLTEQIYKGKGSIKGIPKDIWISKLCDTLPNCGSKIKPSKCKVDLDRIDSGGLIFVKKDSSILCDIYSAKDNAGSYLYQMCFLDTASTRRHDFGKVYYELEGYKAIKLNLNVKMYKD